MTGNKHDAESSGNGRRQCQCSQDETRKKDDKPRKCYNCGKEEHLAIDKNCPAKGMKCAKCGRYRHFALCCLGKSGNFATWGKPDQGWSCSGRCQSYNANFVGDQGASDSFCICVTLQSSINLGDTLLRIAGE